jgi:hypothetical protein
LTFCCPLLAGRFRRDRRFDDSLKSRASRGFAARQRAHWTATQKLDSAEASGADTEADYRDQ